jgi:lipoate-protein ligase A
MLTIINKSDLNSTQDHLDFDDTFLSLRAENDTTFYLRFWECSHYSIILGRNNKSQTEVNEDYAYNKNIEIIKRCSGGGTVILGPGCLCYSLFLPTSHIHCKTITQTNHFVMTTHQQALAQHIPDVEVLGITDLAVKQVKFSGNAQRRVRNYILFHGTFLYNFDISMISDSLAFPSRVPDYRKNRSHSDFVQNITLTKQHIMDSLTHAWDKASTD